MQKFYLKKKLLLHFSISRSPRQINKKFKIFIEDFEFNLEVVLGDKKLY